MATSACSVLPAATSPNSQVSSLHGVQGYAERKILLLCDVIQVCRKLHNDEVRKERLAALKPRTVRVQAIPHDAVYAASI